MKANSPNQRVNSNQIDGLKPGKFQRIFLKPLDNAKKGCKIPRNRKENLF